MGTEANPLQDLFRHLKETGRKIEQLQEQHDQMEPWCDELEKLHSTFTGHAARSKAAKSKALADSSPVNAADLQAVHHSYIRALKQFQKVCHTGR